MHIISIFCFQKEQMQRHICSLQVSRMCGSHALSTDHLTALYTAFTLHYEHGLNAFGIDMLPTDFGLSDSYALLAGELGHFTIQFHCIHKKNGHFSAFQPKLPCCETHLFNANVFPFIFATVQFM